MNPSQDKVKELINNLTRAELLEACVRYAEEKVRRKARKLGAAAMDDRLSKLEEALNRFMVETRKKTDGPQKMFFAPKQGWVDRYYQGTDPVTDSASKMASATMPIPDPGVAGPYRNIINADGTIMAEANRSKCAQQAPADGTRVVPPSNTGYAPEATAPTASYPDPQLSAEGAAHKGVGYSLSEFAVGDRVSVGPMHLKHPLTTVSADVFHHIAIDPTASPSGIPFSVALEYLKAGRTILAPGGTRYIMQDGQVRQTDGTIHTRVFIGGELLLSSQWMVLPEKPQNP